MWLKIWYPWLWTAQKKDIRLDQCSMTQTSGVLTKEEEEHYWSIL